jgi:hypothetical protein
MRIRKKRINIGNKYDRDIDKMILDYITETGDKDWTRMKVALWAIRNHRWEQHEESAAKELARHISQRARTKTFTTDEGDTVRKWHAWRPGDDQPTFWSSMDTITPENMRYSINSRRDKLVNGAVKAIIDAEYFNKHHNPGDPINVETDLTKDVNEKRQPGLYDDVRPDDK